jgi:hypothetical protein
LRVGDDHKFPWLAAARRECPQAGLDQKIDLVFFHRFLPVLANASACSDQIDKHKLSFPGVVLLSF